MKGFIETEMDRARPLWHREVATERCSPGIAGPCDPTCREVQEAAPLPGMAPGKV